MVNIHEQYLACKSGVRKCQRRFIIAVPVRKPHYYGFNKRINKKCSCVQNICIFGPMCKRQTWRNNSIWLPLLTKIVILLGRMSREIIFQAIFFKTSKKYIFFPRYKKIKNNKKIILKDRQWLKDISSSAQTNVSFINTIIMRLAPQNMQQHLLLTFIDNTIYCNCLCLMQNRVKSCTNNSKNF